MAYGASKALAENLALEQMYSEIKKVISINIVYFNLGQGQDYIYKGGTTFKGIHEKDTLLLSNKQKPRSQKKTLLIYFPNITS